MTPDLKIHKKIYLEYLLLIIDNPVYRFKQLSHRG